jgi:hypothetical protein
MRLSSLVLPAVFILLLAVPAVSAESSVLRTVTTASSDTDEQIEVILTIREIPYGGIVETLPPGCTFVTTDHPADQVSVTGESIVFAVLGEPEIRYTARVSVSCTGSITGRWAALDRGLEGTIPPDPVGAADGSAGHSASLQESPGFAAFSGAAALGVALVLLGRRRGGA